MSQKFTQNFNLTQSEPPFPPMDALYIFKHSVNDDFEMRYSLRSIERYAPYIRKVWIYGDQPKFLADDTSLIEHVPQERKGDIVDSVTN